MSSSRVYSWTEWLDAHAFCSSQRKSPGSNPCTDLHTTWISIFSNSFNRHHLPEKWHRVAAHQWQWCGATTAQRLRISLIYSMIHAFCICGLINICYQSDIAIFNEPLQSLYINPRCPSTSRLFFRLSASTTRRQRFSRQHNDCRNSC